MTTRFAKLVAEPALRLTVLTRSSGRPWELKSGQDGSWFLDEPAKDVTPNNGPIEKITYRKCTRREDAPQSPPPRQVAYTKSSAYWPFLEPFKAIPPFVKHWVLCHLTRIQWPRKGEKALRAVEASTLNDQGGLRELIGLPLQRGLFTSQKAEQMEPLPVERRRQRRRSPRRPPIQ